MSNPYSNVEFKYPFREYQRHAIESCEKLMADDRIHIVAAPGSGKTVLGLELARRLGHPVLILVPTINLREQWIDRFFEGFVREEDKDYWEDKISIDLGELKLINCVTYQALFSYLQDNKPEVLVKRLLEASVTVLCLDEAHHLKNEWWKALESVVELLEKKEKLMIISLTATPPYDSDNREWLRYSKLCGEIDIEINAPSMVKNGCICPYQDYVYMCVPDEQESAEIGMLLTDKHARMNKILKSECLYKALMGHKGLSNIAANIDVFMANPEYLDSLIAYINSYATYLRYDYESGRAEAKKAFEKMDESVRELIIEDLEIEIDKGKDSKALRRFKEFQMSEENFFNLLEGMLNADAESYSESFRERLIAELTHLSFFRDGKLVKRRSEEQISSILKNSVSQFDGIVDIVKNERANLGDELRCLILTDRIRKESLDKVQTEEMPGELGCVSIWETLRRAEQLSNIDNYMQSKADRIVDVGMLTATLAIVPEAAMEEIKAGSVAAIVATALKDTGYVKLEVTDANRKCIVSSITQLFDRGVIKVLVGTIALLGEGWDAPCVNSVIMASNLATYVQTNQIRGRGFRINKGNPEKTANLWHLFCVRPVDTEGAQERIYEPGINAIGLSHRFDTIIGISHDGRYISSGIDRVMPVREYYRQSDIDRINQGMMLGASERKHLYNDWKLLTSVIDVDEIPYVVNVARDVKSDSSRVNLWDSMKRRFFRDKSYTRANILAKTTMAAMKKQGLLGENSRLQVDYEWGAACTSIRLMNTTNKENQMFTKALDEVVGKITNTRYLVVGAKFLDRKYLAVPSVLDKNKEGATAFFEELMKNKPRFSFAKPELVYTQSESGKRQLIGARLESFEKNNVNVEVVRRLYG